MRDKTYSPHDHAIVAVVASEPAIARVICEATGIARGTVYRRTKRLVELEVLIEVTVCVGDRQLLEFGLGPVELPEYPQQTREPGPESKVEQMHPMIYAACLAVVAGKSKDDRKVVASNPHFRATHANP